MTLLILAIVVTYLLAINFVAFAAFGFDKIRAEAGQWRISEGTLLFWALLGGTVGAFAGRSLFRHKTRKESFSNQLYSIAILQLAALVLIGGWLLLG
jgi:uncharacterized membrane protein YsdA (DUF1294 family)